MDTKKIFEVLKPYQTKNIETEKIQNLLAAVNIEASFDEAEDMYKKYFKEELAINKNGEVVSRYDIATDKLEGDIRPFAIDVKKHQAMLKSGEDVAFPLYIYEKDGQRGRMQDHERPRYDALPGVCCL